MPWARLMGWQRTQGTLTLARTAYMETITLMGIMETTATTTVTVQAQSLETATPTVLALCLLAVLVLPQLSTRLVHKGLQDPTTPTTSKEQLLEQKPPTLTATVAL